MKRMMALILIMLLVFGFTQAAISAESAKIDWKQATADLPYVQEWIIYSGDAANPTVELTRIPYTGGGTYTSTIPITVTGTPGTKVRKYFSIATVSKNGTATAKVAGATATVPPLAYLEFTVPYPNVSSPFEVIISIVGTP